MKVKILQNKRENFKAIYLDLDPDDKPFDVPTLFVYNIAEEKWIDFSRYWDSPEIEETTHTTVSEGTAVAFLTEIAMDMPNIVSARLKTLIANSQKRKEYGRSRSDKKTS